MSHAVPLSGTMYHESTDLPAKSHKTSTNILSQLLPGISLFIATLLICLGVRMVLALVVYASPFASYLTAITDPFIRPFTQIINDSHSMIQVSTMFAFCAYYLVHFFTSTVARRMKRSTTHKFSQQQTA